MNRISDGAIEIGGRTVALSSTEKTFFPEEGITKGDVVAYYRDAAEVMVPHLLGRPLTLQRFPDGIGGDGFYQKDASDHFPDWIRTVEVPRRGEGGVVHHVVCDEPAALVYLANQGTLTFHVSPARAGAIDVPDVVVIDLDPVEGADLAPVRAAARSLRDLLREVGLTPFLQTTGSKGYHVVAPIEPEHGFDRVRAFARVLGEVAAARDPEHLTTAVRKERREGRVYVDTARNGYAQTFVAPYAIRPRPGAPVATPLDWDELGRVDPGGHTVRSLRRRLAQKSDPWSAIRDAAGDLTAAVGRLEAIRTRRLDA